MPLNRIKDWSFDQDLEGTLREDILSAPPEVVTAVAETLINRPKPPTDGA